MQKKNRYHNRVATMGVFRVLFLGCFLGACGIAFVTVRNQHVIIGDEITATEERIAAQTREIEMWELRIASVEGRLELGRRLRWNGSTLQQIDPARVIEIQTGEDLGRPVASAF